MFKRITKRSRLQASFERLESRRLLTNDILYQGQQGDFTGTDASVGADGKADIHFTLSNIPPANGRVPAISSADIVGTLSNNTQVSWRYGANPSGLPNAELIRRTIDPNLGSDFPYSYDNQSTTAELYLGALPGTDTLSSIAVTLHYADGSTLPLQLYPLPASHSPIVPNTPVSYSPSIQLPLANMGLMAEYAGQYTADAPAGSGNYKAGDLHVHLDSLPAGLTVGSIVSANLSDPIAYDDNHFDGLQDRTPNPGTGDAVWTYNASGATPNLPLRIGSAGDLTFRPVRDENGSTMTLRLTFSNGSSYYTQFTVGSSTNVNLISPAVGFNLDPQGPAINLTPSASFPNQVSYQDPANQSLTITSTFATLLTKTGPRYAHIHLGPGTYGIDSPNPTQSALTIGQPLLLEGDPAAAAILSFTANSSLPADPMQHEPDFAPMIAILSSHVTLSGFKVRFPNPVHFLSDEGGGVITISGTPAGPFVDVNLKQLDIEGPAPAYHGTGSTKAGDLGISTLQGRASQNLISGGGASGSIVGNTLRGGGIDLSGGPWAIIGNNDIGTVPARDQYPSNGATIPAYTGYFLKADIPHDVSVALNHVSVSPYMSGSPLGDVYRLSFTKLGDPSALSGYNVLVKNNTFDGGAGRCLTSSVNKPSDPNTFRYVDPANDPEVILNETYVVLYEGCALPIAANADGHILTIPPPSFTVGGRPVRNGDMVSILSGPNAWQWRRIAQVIDQGVFLMDLPMPAGSYSVEISRGLVNTVIDGDTIDLRNTTSIGVDLQGNQFGAQVINNHIIDDSINGNGTYNLNVAIRAQQ